MGTPPGGKLQVNDLLAIIGKAGEDISSLLKSSSSSSPATSAPATAPKQSANAEEGASLNLSTIPEVILMPRLSDTMTEGVIANWHKKIGDTVKKGDLLVDVETDKATMELESYKDGKLLYIGAQPGEKDRKSTRLNSSHT